MNILFHTYTLNYRGSTRAIADYARYNQEILGNSSTIIYEKGTFDGHVDMQTEQAALDYFNNEFNVISYTDANSVNEIASKYDVFYSLRAGWIQEPLVTSTKTANHAVFQTYDPHGDTYAYVSDWLSLKMSGGKLPYVPHIVQLPSPNQSARETFRTQLGISKDKFVFGRYGALTAFNVLETQGAIVNIVSKYNDIVFVFMNTQPFFYHPNIIYLNPTTDSQIKSDYISACDAMIHARGDGESFGLAICEFLFHDKPVLAWEGGQDQHHTQLLKNHNLLYNLNNVEEMMLDLTTTQKYPNVYRDIVKRFNPDTVMKKFNDVFFNVT
jgi:hypothetical protein